MARNTSFLDDVDDLEDIDTSSDVPEKFKVESKDATYRIAFPLIKKNGKVAIVPVTFYTFEDDDGDWHKIPVPKNEDGSVNEELDKKLQIYCGEAKTRWVTMIIKYVTKKDGKVTTMTTADVVALPLAKKSVKALKNIDEEFPLAEYDVKVTSDNPEFNDFQFVPSGKALYLSDKCEEETADEWVDEAYKLAENMTKIFCYPKGDAEIRKILGLDDMDDGDDEEFDSALDDEEDFEDEKPARKSSRARSSKEEDDEEEEEKPTRKARRAGAEEEKPAARKPKKPAKEESELEDDDDDFED